MTAAVPSPVPLALPARVLLLGSGELGKEVTISVQRLGCHVIAVDSYPNAPAMQVADESRVIDMTDEAALAELIGNVDVDLIVPEVEAIATHVLAQVEAQGVARVVPNAFAVQATMDRQRIRALAASLPGVVTSKFAFASSADEVRAALEHTGLPAFIKPTMSSSGHGQSRITSADEAQSAWDTAMSGARAGTGRVIVEEGIDFDSEITLLTVRWWDDNEQTVRTSFCAPIGHRQVSGDYVESWQIAELSEAALAKCHDMARSVTQALADGPHDATPHAQSLCLGLFGVEFFIKGDEVWFSELSPRPHDTGMVTMVTQEQSEFDIHARAILGLPVCTDLVTPGASAVIKNTDAFEDVAYDGVAQALHTGHNHGGQVRIFGKQTTRAGRRLGVALARATDADEARRVASSMAAQITPVPARQS